ncbi:protein argonaute 4a [Phtheirospermum japonicum]|uniref:Protein argonaute 4a n=1 Tax=Phtheirospermum japonicum TaxID=374723 RepID=A0A830BTY0_9LAMI|nr:protein argonaute 4a [Phtheirospermum japonicum]
MAHGSSSAMASSPVLHLVYPTLQVSPPSGACRDSDSYLHLLPWFPFSTKTVSRSTARASARKCSTGFNRRELAGIEFAYDGEKSLFTVGALPQKKMEFIVVLDDITSSRNSGNSSPGHGSPNDGDRKRMKCPYHSKTFKVELSFAAKIPMQAIAMLCVVRNLKIRRVVCSFANRFSITIRRAFVRSEVVFLAVEGFTRALGPP